MDGVLRLSGFAPLRTPRQAEELFVSVGIPVEIALAEANRNLIRNLVGLALIALLALTAAWFGGDLFVLRRVKALVSAAKRFSAGDLTARTGGPYGPGELDQLTGAFDRMAESLERREAEHRRAEEELLTRTRQLEAVRAVTAEITRELNLATLLGLITRRAAELVGTALGTVSLWDETAQVLVPQAWHGHGEWRAGARLRLGEGVAGTAAQRRNGLIVNDYRTSPYAHPLFLEKTAISAVLAEPLLYQERLVGVITLSHQGTGRRFTEKDRATLALFAIQAAIAIENARLHETTVRRAQQLATLTDLTRMLTTALDTQAATQEILKAVQVLMPGAVGRLRELAGEEGVLCLLASIGLRDPASGIESHSLHAGEGLTSIAVHTRQPVISQDISADPRFLNKAWAEAEGLVSGIILPLIFREQLNGTLAIFTREPHAFSEEEVSLLRAFAAQAAIALENARLFAELNRSYHNLQRALDELVRTEKLRALGQMAAGIAHDLNNMLAAVLGQAELLRLQVKDPAVQQALAILATAATDGADVVRRLQGFAGQQSSGSLVPCDLATLVREAVELTRPRWRDAPQRQGRVIELRINLSAPGGLPPILGQPAEIREALTNLILNAVDAMPAGGTLTLAARVLGDSRWDEPGDPNRKSKVENRQSGEWVELTVTDTGVGMTEEVRRRAFDPFFTTKGGQGTGLGLSLVYGILERHGGHITVTSAPGEGTTFSLRFQTAPALLSAPDTAAAADRPIPQRRLLLIEDDPVVRQTVAGLLRTAGHTVLEADGGAAGLARLTDGPVDLVLSDLGMPEMTGWDVARAVKARHPQLPVVILTGWGEQLMGEAGNTALSGMVDRVLGKPFRLEDLLGIIAELTASPSQWP